MELAFTTALEEEYNAATQKIRILTEHWVRQQVYFPSCGCANISRYGNNPRVAEFFCAKCHENYELKVHGKAIGPTVPDRAHRTMIQRLK